MNCSSCGIAVNEGARFCQQCGHSVRTSANEAYSRAETQLTITPEMMQQFVGWRGPAIGAAATCLAGLVLALLANVVMIAAVKGFGFYLSYALGLLVYGSLGVKSVGSGVSLNLEGVTTSAHYSTAVTILGGFLLMLAAIVFGGWIASRQSGASQRGTFGVGVKTALLFAVLMFIGSFLFSYAGMHPQHFEALMFPLLFGLLLAPAGARLERDGRGFWRAPVGNAGSRFPRIVQAIGAGFDALSRTLKLTGAATILTLVALALNYPDAAGKILGGRQIIAEILLLPLWLPHLVGAMFLAAQGIAFHAGPAGSAGIADSFSGGSASGTISIFGASDGVHMPWYLTLAIIVPIVSGLWGGHLAACRRTGTIRERLTAALWASVPFLLLTWILAILVGIQIEGGIGALDLGMAIGPVAANAIFWPILWGPVVYALGAGLQAWRAGDLAPLAAQYRERIAAATMPAPGTDGAAAAATLRTFGQQETTSPERASFCPDCGTPRTAKRFCTSCGHQYES